MQRLVVVSVVAFALYVNAEEPSEEDESEGDADTAQQQRNPCFDPESWHWPECWTPTPPASPDRHPHSYANPQVSPPLRV